MADQGRSRQPGDEENVLYDLTINAEWPQEPETINKTIKERSQITLFGRIASVAQRSTWTFLRSIGFPSKSSSPCSLPAGLVKLVNSSLGWQITISGDGQLVAVLQDNVIEIRSARDQFDSVHSKCNIRKDLHPKWRRIQWSADSSMLAYASSSGDVKIFDIMGLVLCEIPCKIPVNPNLPTDLSRAIAAFIFTDYKANDDWSAELLVINYQGCLRSYLLAQNENSSGQGYVEQHYFLFSSHYPRGICSAVYHPEHRLIIIGGTCEDQEELSCSNKYGITAWRCLSGSPHYKLVTDYEQDKAMANKKISILKRIKSAHFYSWHGDQQDSIFKMCLSPDGKVLATVHHSGRLALWEIPSLKLRSLWEQHEQPGFDAINPIIAENPKSRRHGKEHFQKYNLIDVNWWTCEALILARCSGSVTVSSAKTLRNLLGSSPEWFDPAPLVTQPHEGGFLGLECECQYQSLKRRLVEDVQEDEEYEDSDEEDDVTIVTKTTRYIKYALYYVTDSQRFQPPRKRPKIVKKTYRLVCLKSTTPEELFARKIDDEEYGEALQLAKAYGLDADLVYQRQWRKTDVSVASIQDYLSKISKRTWVLHECLERVPGDIDAMRELLQYGLRGTDLEALIAIGKREDQGRFIMCDTEPLESLEESFDEYDEEQVQARLEKEKKRKAALLEEVDFNNLTLEQKELCRSRMKLIQYLDRLSTYEEILGGVHAAEEHFDPTFFEKFRSQNIVEIAADYARASDHTALRSIFTYHGENTLVHRLAILANFPETTSPFEYRALLPEISVTDANNVLSWTQESWREMDWCYTEECRSIVDPSPPDLGEFLYLENEEYRKFRTLEISADLLSEWYQHRACEIERESRQVDNALELIRLAMERDVQGLDLLYDDFLTMESLVYECFIEESLTFKNLQKMSNIEKVRLMMDKSSDEMYEKNLQRWLKPFLQRCEKQKPGSWKELVREYILERAQEDLSQCLKIFQCSTVDSTSPLLTDEEQLLSIALECIYTCERNDQRQVAVWILECLPTRDHSSNKSTTDKLHDKVDDMERHLSAAEILERNELACTMSYIRKSEKDPDETKSLLRKLTRIAGRRTSPLTEKQWKKLLTDMLDLQAKVYGCVAKEMCYEIFVESLLCSGRRENFHLASTYLQDTSDEHYQPPTHPGVVVQYQIPYKQSIQLVLMAEREYFDSSANLMDECMDLARGCLSLISDVPVPPAIQDELDLIASLGILDDFGVTMLPLQVRICKERLDLVQKAIQAKPLNYKNYGKLLKLGQLLRVTGDSKTEREGRVLRKVAQTALEAKDYKITLEMCQRLIKDGYEPIWMECKQLAEEEEFRDIQEKIQLLAFAVSYCSAEMIEPILRAKCLLETKILCDSIYAETHAETNADENSKSPRQSPFSARGAIEQTREILTSTTKTTKSLLSTFSDKKWWKSTLENLDPLRKTSATPLGDKNGNENFLKQGCHPFYEDVIENCFSNVGEVNYGNLDYCPTVIAAKELSENLLRTAKLEETLTEGESVQTSTEVLHQLAKETIAKDTSLGMAYLFSMPKALDADNCLNSLPRTAISLQLAVYYYALEIYNTVNDWPLNGASTLYHYDPVDVIQSVLQSVKISTGSKELKNVQDLVSKLQYYQTLLEDYNQAEMLKGLGRGVDVSRFTLDKEYKEETILGLAMCLEQDVYDIAISLAKKYDISMWDVYMNHLEFLFSDSGLATSDVESRVNDLAILPTLLTDPIKFVERMNTYVFPTICGTDHSRLLYYYTLLDGCSTQESVSPETHVKLLKKIKSAAPGLDYKRLLQGKSSPLDVLKPILTSSNVHVLAKLAQKIPDKSGQFLQSSTVFCGWAQKLFWEGDQTSKKMPQSESEWIHRYEVCAQFMEKLVPGDVLTFAEGITFSEGAIDQLNPDCRKEIVKRCLKFCRQQAGKKRKLEETNVPVSWEDAGQQLQQWLTHLDLVGSDVIKKMLESDDQQMKSYARKFDMSRSLPEKIKNILMEMLIDGQSMDIVSEIFELVAMTSCSFNSVVMETLTLLTEDIKSPGSYASLIDLGSKNSLEVLKTVVLEISNNGGDLINPEEVISRLRPFCADSTVDIQPRLDVLQILEQSFNLSAADLVLLVYYRTDAVLSTVWTDFKLTEADIQTEESRQELFATLLSQSTGLGHFQALGQLLQVWPHTEEVLSNPSTNPAVRLFTTLLDKCEDAGKTVFTLYKDFHKSIAFNDKCVNVVFTKLLDGGYSLEAMKLCLFCEQDEFYEKVVEQLRDFKEPCEDQELLDLILKCSLLAKTVSTVFYPSLVEYILANQNDETKSCDYLNVETLTQELAAAGCEAEAGSLLLQYRGMHPMLQTFDSALGLVARWFKR